MKDKEAVTEEPKREHVRVKIPDPVITDRNFNPQNHVMEVIRAVAQAANECGIEGKLIEGLAFYNRPGALNPDIVFEVRQLMPESPTVQ